MVDQENKINFYIERFLSILVLHILTQVTKIRYKSSENSEKEQQQTETILKESALILNARTSSVSEWDSQYLQIVRLKNVSSTFAKMTR